MEIIDLRVIERAKRDGFRAASAGYLIKLITQALGVNTDDIQDDERLESLSKRMGVTRRVLVEELKKINEAVKDRVSPGEVYDYKELRRHKGRIDLQSLLCNGLYNGVEVYHYENYLSYIMPPNSDRIVYTTDIPITISGDVFTINSQHNGRYHIHYASKVSDTKRMFNYTKFRLHSGSQTVVIDGIGVESIDNGMMTLALNIDMSQHDKFSTVHNLLMSANYVTYSYDKVAPFIIERAGLDQGTLIMHVFPHSDGTALTKWMQHCETSLERMLISILNTLKTKGEAYSSKGLGGQFPIDFYGVLRGTLDALDPARSSNSNTSRRIPDRVVIDELFKGYINGVRTGVVSERIRIAFGCLKTRNKPHNLINLQLFIKSYLSFAGLFQYYDDIMTFNKDVNGVKDVAKQSRVTEQLLSFIDKGSIMLKELGQKAGIIVDKLPNSADEYINHIINQVTEIISPVQRYLN
jgi:hypothetical protein